MALGRSAVLVSALAVGALLTTGSTYAAFSDYADVTGNQVSAGTVVVGGTGGSSPALSYSGLLPGASATQLLHLQYAGTISADLWIELEPGLSGAAFCDGGSAKPGGAVQVQVNGGGWVDYCSALGGHHFAIASDVSPSTTLDVQVDVQLVDGTDARYSDLSGVGDLTVHALQSGGAGFSDFARGTISIGLGTIAPTIPQQCLDAGLTDFDASNTIYLTPEDLPFDVGKLPDHGRGYLIIGTDGDDVITGSNQADCIIGGAGNDHLVGGNQNDVLIGGDGDDVLNGSGGDDKAGGNGKDQLYGGDGDDELHGGNGKDVLDAGDGTDVCVDTRNGKGNGGNGGAGGPANGNGAGGAGGNGGIAGNGGNGGADDPADGNGAGGAGGNAGNGANGGAGGPANGNGGSGGIANGTGAGTPGDTGDNGGAGGLTGGDVAGGASSDDGIPGGNGKDTFVGCESDGTAAAPEGLTSEATAQTVAGDPADGGDAPVTGEEDRGAGSLSSNPQDANEPGSAHQSPSHSSDTSTSVEPQQLVQPEPTSTPGDGAADGSDSDDDEPPASPSSAPAPTTVATEPSSLFPADA